MFCLFKKITYSFLHLVISGMVLNFGTLENPGASNYGSRFLESFCELLKTLFFLFCSWFLEYTMDTSSAIYYRWLGIISLTVIYNSIVLPMRAAFTQFHELSPPTWMVIDYCIDAIYIVDIWIGCRTGRVPYDYCEMFL